MNFLFLFSFFVTISAQVFELNVNDEHIQLDPSETQNFQIKDEHNDDKPSTQKLNFEKSYYIVNDEKPKLKMGHKSLFDVQMNHDLVKGDFKLTDVQKFGMEEYFTVSSVDNIKVSVDVKSDIPEGNLKDKNQLIFLLEFIPENKEDTIHTMLIMSLKAPDSEESNGSKWFILTSILSAILAVSLIVTILYLVNLRSRKSPAFRRRRNGNNRSPVTVLEDDMELPSQTRYIGADENVRVVSRFDQINSNAFLNPTFQSSQSVVYSDTRSTGDVITIRNNSQPNMNDFSSPDVSSFKPSSADVNFSSNNMAENLDRDLEFSLSGNAASSSSSSNIHVLDVRSQPHAQEQQLSQRTNTNEMGSSKL